MYYSEILSTFEIAASQRLLNHTHGLTSPTVARIPRAADGRIDIDFGTCSVHGLETLRRDMVRTILRPRNDQLGNSHEKAAAQMAGRVFGDVLPEFSGLRPPRMLNSQERSALQPGRYTGSYVQAQSRLSVGIGTTAHASECLTIEMQKSDGTTTAQRLRAAEDHIFIPESQDNRELPFIQFVAPEPTLRFGYLWNGKQLWRRE